MAAKRMKMLVKNYLDAKKQGLLDGYDIQCVEEDNYEHFYILLKPNSGIYRDQFQIIEMKTTYGANREYSYPIQAPYMKFITPVYHTNISEGGAICLDILKDRTKWMPTYDFVQVIFNIMLLYQDPNTSSPFNGNASVGYSDCRQKFRQLKQKNMTVEEIEELEDRCFASYKEQADKYARKGNIKPYSKWFPQIIGKSRSPDEMQELEAMYENLCAEKKEKKEKKEKAKKPNRWAKYQKKADNE